MSPSGTVHPFVPILRVRDVPHSKDLPSFLSEGGLGIDPPQRVDSIPPKGTSPTPTPFLTHETKERVRTGRWGAST